MYIILFIQYIILFIHSQLFHILTNNFSTLSGFKYIHDCNLYKIIFSIFEVMTNSWLFVSQKLFTLQDTCFISFVEFFRFFKQNLSF